jgi:omega-6 fatty acid desaturase (delta-12 desaturase)
VAEVRQAAAAFAHPIAGQAMLQLLTSVGPFIAGCVAMYVVLPISYLLTLALALPTGALLIRVFIVQHDCGHGSFFASRRANALAGRLCSLCTLTPYANWSRQHSVHHADWNNLHRTGGGTDMYSACLTMRDYFAMSRRGRFLYRLPRHPLIANLLLPPVVFLLVYRLPLDTPRHWRRERRSVHLTNAALLGVFGMLAWLLGWRQVLLVHLPVMVVASILGIALFSVQHRFETAHWMEKGNWNFVEAALEGSSWLHLPSLLQWLTGNIGFHHVHHLNPRVPSYRLAEAHSAVQAICPVPPISLRDGIRALRLTLWDEVAGRLIGFPEATGQPTRTALHDGRAARPYENSATLPEHSSQGFLQARPTTTTHGQSRSAARNAP